MYHPWFFGRRRCCCHRNCHLHGRDSSGVYSTAHYRHFANVPMQIFYGPGFTAEDSLENIDNALETIAEAFSHQQAACGRSCC